MRKCQGWPLTRWKYEAVGCARQTKTEIASGNLAYLFNMAMEIVIFTVKHGPLFIVIIVIWLVVWNILTIFPFGWE